MNDYQLIRKDPSYSRFRSIDTRIIYNESVKWLEKSLRESKARFNVVVTHHAPSLKSIKGDYKEDLISAAFASNLKDFILRTHPNLWIHGHIHEPSDYYIGKTRVICNPVGYPGENLVGFKKELIFEIDY